MSNEAEILNIEAISKAIDKHNRNCDFPATAVVMHPIECERLDWDEIKGIPIIDDPKLGTGTFRLLCDLVDNKDEDEVQEESGVFVDADSFERNTERELIEA